LSRFSLQSNQNLPANGAKYHDATVCHHHHPFGARSRPLITFLHNHLNILIHDTVALITILNPLAAASIMVSMIATPSPATIRTVARRATFTVLIASLVTLFTGEYIFKFFGINILSIKVIGGLILMMIAVNMAYGQPSKARHTPEEQDEAENKEDISIVPIGIPILFGPGVIATLIVLNNNNAKILGPIISYGSVSVAVLIASVSVYLALLYAAGVNRVLGVTGMKVLTRIMGLIVGAIAAQFLVSGIKGLWNA
jgi:multiple antibiotic resistance protein